MALREADFAAGLRGVDFLAVPAASGGGFPGGGPPGMAGGDRGSRGGPPGMTGGDRGSRGGPPGSGFGDRGGFDPASMLSRMDANGNGQLDPEELQGPARFMLDRVGQNDPEISKALSNGKPIPLSKITKAIESMRGDSGNSSRSGSNSAPPPASTTPAEPEPLVSGFGVKLEPKPIPGFGPGGADAGAAVKVEERDIKEAKERIERYDKNKDGLLDEKEVADGRWSDNPWAFDRNKDKKLTQQEMAVRYAKRRMTEEADKAKSASSDSRRTNDSRRGDDRNRDRREKEEPANPWSNQASYKYTPKNGQGSKAQGLPEWFSSGDVNGDGQIMMNEYASNWDDAIIAEFNRFDSNGDGSITTLEALSAVKKGLMRGAAVIAPSAGSVSSASSSGVSVSTTPTAASTAAPVNIDRSDLPEGADERWVKFVVSKIAKVDKDRNSRITIDEWTPSEGDFKQIDTNADGSISLGEFYKFKKK